MRFALPNWSTSRWSSGSTQLCADGGFEPAIASTIADVTVARALVAAGPGIAMMGEQTIPRADTSVAIRPLPELPLLTEAAAAHMRPPAS